MASTYTTRLRVELQADGENDSTWGQKANDVFERFDLAISGFTSIPLSDANYTLSVANSDSGADEASCYLLKFTGSLTAGRNIVVPTAAGRWIIWNATTGGYDLTVKTSGGTGATCKNGFITPTFSDGTNVYPSGPPISTAGDISIAGDFTVGDDLTVTDDLTVSGAATITETLTVGGNVTLGDAAADSHTINGLVTMASKPINEFKGADIASATTTDIGAATGNMVDVTGTTTITGLGTIQAGTKRTVRFTGVLILTHNGTSLILPTGDNIVTLAGDVAEFVSLGSGNWVCTNYQRVNGKALSTNYLNRTYDEYTTYTTYTTVLPLDNTIPQNTEGTEIITRAFTPVSASSRIRITFHAMGSTDIAGAWSAALFVDSTADALAATTCFITSANNVNDLTLVHEEASSSTSARTYKIRVGPVTGVTMALNGSPGGGRFFGGVSKATLVIEEII